MPLNSLTKKHIQEVYDEICEKAKNLTPFFVARRCGIKCRLVDFNDDLLAFSERSSSEDKGTIYVNSNLGAYAREILCAHELGHLLLHSDDDSNLFDCEIDPVKECEANYFATLILPHIISKKDIHNMSVEEFNRYISQKVNPLNEIRNGANYNTKVLKLDLAYIATKRKAIENQSLKIQGRS